MKKLLTLLALTLVTLTTNAQSTVKDDMNDDGELNITDVTMMIDLILHSTQEPSYLTCPDSNHPHLIDLGLPSGTKWACCNVGATSPTSYGNYYAWGETEEKEDYDLFSYQFAYRDNNPEDGFWEYDHDTGYWHYENLGSSISGTQYDVAHVKWGGNWVMPNNSQITELIENCTIEFVQMYNYGCKFTGANGGSIFLPAAGIVDELFEYDGRYLYGYYWSSETPLSETYYTNKLKMPSEEEPDYSPYANALYFAKKERTEIQFQPRILGLPVRPVHSK